MRPSDQLREISITRGYLESNPASILYRCGRTIVLCTASIEASVPPWLEGKGKGWVTAEYNMLPHSTNRRKKRDRGGKIDGRTTEIQRLIGRALRAALDLEGLGERTLILDCDVLQADGGTRTAAITGAWVALHDAFDWAVAEGIVDSNPIKGHLAAVSVGLADGDVLLDLEYTEDVAVDVDCNVVMTGDGRVVEIQGTAEGEPFSRERLTAMMDSAQAGIEQLVAIQKAAIAS